MASPIPEIASIGFVNTPTIISPNEENVSNSFPITTPRAAEATSSNSAPFFVLVKKATREPTNTTSAPTPVAMIAPFIVFNPSTNVFAPLIAPLNIVTSPPDILSNPSDI